ncbi:hypothetical protein ABTX82_01940 [Streptomyces lavendulae]|uniref:hypothetical protein n=1 Tax=Streptomyces lavendulae TaxID=1914 RepID=UPI003318950A
MTAADRRANMQAALADYAATRTRLQQAGERASNAERMRRAAVTEMGQAIRDNRATQQRLGAKHKVDMGDAEILTGITRRTLSTAVANAYPPEESTAATMALQDLSDRDLAATYRAYGYDRSYGSDELHRRFPVLAGMQLALEVVVQQATDRWRAANPTVNIIDEPLDVGVEAAAIDIQQAYRKIVDSIADGKPLADPRYV